MTPEESEKLENNILQYGMLDPIKIWQDYKIMGELETREDVKQWMLEQRLGRRNLSDVERYEIVQKFKSIFQKKANKESQTKRKNQSHLRRGS